MKRWLKILIIILPITFLSSMCETNNGLVIPYIRVEEDIFLISDLGGLGDGQSKTHKGGVNGLIIYREDEFTFHAYDRTCTMWPDHNVAVESDSIWEGLIYTCPDCGSQYWLSLGAEPMNGPAVFGLQEYLTVLEGSILLVYN